MKVPWANLKNQNKYSFIDKKKHEDGVTVTEKLAFDKDTEVAAEYSESLFENDQSAYQERQQSLVILITQAKII